MAKENVIEQGVEKVRECVRQNGGQIYNQGKLDKFHRIEIWLVGTLAVLIHCILNTDGTLGGFDVFTPVVMANDMEKTIENLQEQINKSFV